MRTYHSSKNIYPIADNSRLIDLIQNNQEEAYRHFEKLIKSYHKKLRNADAIGELNLFFFELINGIDLNRFNADNTDGLCRYINTSLKHKFIALYKQQQIELLSGYEINENIINIKPDFRGDIEAADLLTALTQKQRIILYYRYFYQLSCAEVADMLGISRQAVNRLENRALKFLREIMKDERQKNDR